MTISTNKSHLSASLRLALALVAVVLIGAALIPRGPDVSLPMPIMAKAPIVMPDGKTFYAQQFEVTVAEWNTCFNAGSCAIPLRVRTGFDATTTPATGLSYVDVNQYLTWINDGTAHEFRLPTVDEWNHMAHSVLPEEPDPIFTDPSLTWAASYLTEGNAPRELKAQGSFSTSPEGVEDLDGSVWEWTQECYAGAADGLGPDRCPAFFVAGEHVAAMSYLIRDPARGGCAVGTPPAHLGMRLVSDYPA